MAINRISRFSWSEAAVEVVAAAAQPGFVVCPSAIIPVAPSPQGTWQQEVFRRAYEAARAMQTAAIPYHHRLFSNWN
jgi:hypothetical protein